tara:strand:+ start:1144 stop:1647 length:504 start_codon:yes stop_codon:yes gene_type:complete
MLKLYALIFVMAILGGIGYGAKHYYDTTQNKIAILTENNAQLEVAVQTANASLETAIANQKKLAELSNKLQIDLQRAEQYGDSLRNKLAELDLVRDALLDAKNLEGRMNGATAKLWREITTDTGGDGSRDIPDWLQQPQVTSGDQNSNQDRKSNDTDGNITEASPTQ